MTPLLWLLAFLTGFAFLEFLASVTRELRMHRRARARLRLRSLAVDVQAQGKGADASILRDMQGERAGTPLRLLAPLKLLLYRAGQPLGPVPFLVLSCGLALAGAGLGQLLFSDPRLSLLLPGAGLLPLLFVYSRKRARMRRFEEMLPEALDLLSRALRAGHALTSGLQMVGDELGEPVGPEFSQVADEVRFGLDLPQALANLSHRIDLPDLPFFVTALVIQRETGGNLAEIIDGLARVMRERQTIEGKVRALTAQTRWSANILLLAPFAFVGAMSVMRPDYIAPLWETSAGNALAGAAACMVIVGYVACRRVGMVRV